jgi:hypothetical protein
MIIPSIEQLGNMTSHRRKWSLSNHQRQIRLLTVMSVMLVLAAFAGLIYWINRLEFSRLAGGEK